MTLPNPHISFRLPPALRARLDAIAALRGLTRTDIIVEGVERRVKHYEILEAARAQRSGSQRPPRNAA